MVDVCAACVEGDVIPDVMQVVYGPVLVITCKLCRARECNRVVQKPLAVSTKHTGELVPHLRPCFTSLDPEYRADKARTTQLDVVHVER